MADERERIAAELDKTAAAVLRHGMALTTQGNEADGTSKLRVAASLDLAADLVRGHIPQWIAVLLQPGDPGKDYVAVDSGVEPA